MIGRLWPLVAATVALGIDAYVLAGILPQIAGSLTTTAAMIGLGVTAFTAAYAVSGPVLASRLGARGAGIALLVALGVFNLGNLITALAPGIGVFLTARVVAGTGAGILTAVATGTAAALAPPAQRGRAMMAMVTFGLSLGTVAGVPLGMLIGRTAGWRWTMGAVVVIGAVAMVAVAVRARTLPSLAGPARPTFPLMRLPRVRAGVGAAFGLGTASLGLYTYLLPMAADAGLDRWGFALVWAWGVGGVTGAALIGRPLDRFGPRRLLIALPVTLAAGFAVMWATSAPGWWLAATTVWGAAGWAAVPTLQRAATAGRPDDIVPIVALQMAAVYLGSAVGSALGGALLTAGTNPAEMAGWALIPIVLAGAVAVGLARSADPDRPAASATAPRRSADAQPRQECQ